MTRASVIETRLEFGIASTAGCAYSIKDVDISKADPDVPGSALPTTRNAYRAGAKWDSKRRQCEHATKRMLLARAPVQRNDADVLRCT
jgi:hypothetical protein